MRALVHKDSSFYRIESFSFDRTGVLVKDPVKAKAETFGNDVKFGLLAFTTDDVGNLANDAYFQSDGEVDNGDKADSDPLIYTVDGILPTVNIVNPKEGGRFTAAKLSAGEAYIDTTEGKRITMKDHMFGQNPLKIKIDEDIFKIEVTLGTAEAPVMSISDLKRAEDDSTVIVEITDYKGPDGEDGEGEDKDETKPDGDELKVKVTVEDEVGNKSKAVEVTATFDNVPLEISDVFPRFPESEAVIDTVTTETVDVSLAISEDADSISVRWFQYKKDDPKGSILEPKIGIAKDIPKGDVDDRFDDFTFGDDDNNKTFTLQIFARDKAGNVTLTEPDTLFFSEEFKNPVADTFLVTRPKGSDDKVLPDSSIVGQELTLNIEARTKGEKGKTAVTYDDQAKDNDVLVSVLVLNEEMEHVLADSGRFTISEDLEEGVKNTVNMDGTVSLNRKGWDLGKRTITVTTDTAVAMVIVKVEDTSTQTRTDQDTPEETTMERVPNFGGGRDNLVWEVGEFSEYDVTVKQDDDGSSGFTITVVPTDSFGNQSTKTTGGKVTTDDDNEGAAFLTSRLPAENILKTVSVTLSSPTLGVTLLEGRQEIAVDADGNLSGNTFRGTAPSGDVEIVVRATSALPSGVGSDASRSATGSSKAVDFKEPDPEPDPDPEELAAPANLLVQDYKGALGDGDQGGYVLVSFPSSEGAEGYQLWREIQVNTRLNEDGMAFEDTTSWAELLMWAPIEAVDGDIVRAVVPVPDGDSTMWAIQAHAGGQRSAQTVSGKRVFSRESVQLMAQFLGIDPNRVLSYEELSKVFSPPQDYVKSILGDQEGVIFAPMNPDLTVLLATPTVPQNIRTASHEVRMSEHTFTEGPAGAVDDIQPAAVTKLEGEMEDGNIALNWLASADDKVVGFINYRGHAVSIPGVASYNVWRSVDDGDWEMVGSVEQGATSFVDENVPEGASMVRYRVDAADLDNQMPSEMLSVPVTGYVSFTDADGSLIYVVDLSPGRTDFTPSFRDFAVLASAFGANEGDANYVEQADTNQDGVVDFADFASFASTFGKKPSLRNGRPIGATKLVMVPRLGVNEDAEMLLSNNTDRVLVGQQISLDVSVANTKALKGFGFVLTFDSEKFEFLKAAPAENDLLKSAGGETPVFFEQSEQSGQIMVANSLADGEVVSGEGSVVTLTFKVLKEFEDNARFEIIEGIVFDHKLLSNQMVVLGALNVETTPTEFALFQNFPNPFNPETTIKYNLAEGSDVHLQIYNILGQVVRTMVAERQSAGRYQVKWSGTDDRGMPVSSGIYFYQLATGGKFHDVKRLMLLK